MGCNPDCHWLHRWTFSDSTHENSLSVREDASSNQVGSDFLSLRLGVGYGNGPWVCSVVVNILTCIWEDVCHSSSVQFRHSSHVQLFVTPWTTSRQVSLSIINSWRLLKLMSIELVMSCNHLILCCPHLLPPSIFPSIRVFSNESALHIRWPKYCSFSFSIRPSNEYSGLISCRMDWLDLIAVQGTLKSLIQHHSSKASVLWCSAFFTVQLSHLYLTTRKNHGFD